VVKKNQLRAFQFDATHSPDLFPPLAVLAACCEGTSKIKGVSRLKNKESNRAQTIREEFLKLNIEVKNVGDVMYIEGSKVKGGKVSSRNDHRIAMATAVLASVADGKIEIENSRAVDKSYPTFFEDLKTVSQDRN
jgi:3-phosphoshikimate 1-carboxyvinyltransferase